MNISNSSVKNKMSPWLPDVQPESFLEIEDFGGLHFGKKMSYC